MLIKVCIISFPFRPLIDSNVPLMHLVKILAPICQEIYILSSNMPLDSFSPKTKVIDVKWKISNRSILSRISNNFITQLKYSYYLARRANDIDSIIFLGASTFCLPMLISKLLKKKALQLTTTSETRMVKHNSNRYGYTINILYLMTRLFERFNYVLADQVIVYSLNIVNEWNLSKFANKISIAYEHFLDVNIFRVTKNLSSRGNTIGYIGRLSEEKGVMEFVNAITKTLSIKNDLKFLICGNGYLKNKIGLYLKENSLTDHVRLMDAIPHDYLPTYLNELKLIVIPSYTEGLPNVMLESMACGTPVLATSVGAIPDIIKDGKTGLLMESNSSDCIASNIMRALNHPELEGIAQRARTLVEAEFTFDKGVERWGKILEKICNSR